VVTVALRNEHRHGQAGHLFKLGAHPTLPLGIAAFIASLGAALMAGGPIAAAPSANAGCQHGGLVISKCDGPVQPDGTWQPCMVVAW